MRFEFGLKMEKRRPWYFSACSLIGLFLFLITAQAFALGIKHEDPLLPRFKISSGVLRDGEQALMRVLAVGEGLK
jgi:hypothetical protein